MTMTGGWLWEGVRPGRFVLWLIVGVLLMIIILFAWRNTEEFLIKDSRFRITEADDLAGQSSNLVVEGIHYASASQIRHIFAEDFGRSLYLVPIGKRRQRLLDIDWIGDVSVARIWPNTLKVQVQERTPVAFVHLPPNAKDGMSSFALIDREGFILRPRMAAKFTLPVITGIRESEPPEDRRARVHRVLAMLKELGPLGKDVSEINAADPNNLVVAEHVEDTVVNLMLGEENYSERLQNFIANYSEIRAKRPDVKTLDLRVDGIITAVGDERHGK
ncbi:MAG: FtsQ-type POTRA domain-containing protein [Acidobacteriaceae bacterium]|nr:FtsQ-type POTRA domain-containing protein [Acidobacteriaceae bacterium]MBV9035009.1 FtsQ-type POTRA domain-containing protein [Acidobacteriaceae bacterium]MBV9223029.1 FtsQ-type POTRA domain-containing protein [Acidobacteriaceae bacterium]MBV9308674.1 FtsQ-type POTRA domain-containing protein [Acidobacteriaceae bacterium]MBV9675777.1 FtsQ-type POTRA domain-containing protein [Acidobacteriaceae bacterium]